MEQITVVIGDRWVKVKKLPQVRKKLALAPLSFRALLRI